MLFFSNQFVLIAQRFVNLKFTSSEEAVKQLMLKKLITILKIRGKQSNGIHNLSHGKNSFFMKNLRKSILIAYLLRYKKASLVTDMLDDSICNG